jgi:hypothetical protein
MLSNYKDIDASLLIRTDFSDDTKWARVLALANASYEEGFCAILQPIDDPAYTDVSSDQLVAEALETFEGRALFVADSHSISIPEHLILCVEISTAYPRSFYTIPSQLWSVENNMRLSNMDFADFHGNVDSDGVFRGFK